MKGQTYLSSLLSTEYFDPGATDGWEALLRKSTAAWGEASTGSVTGDYFLLETMASVGFLLLGRSDVVLSAHAPPPQTFNVRALHLYMLECVCCVFVLFTFISKQ